MKFMEGGARKGGAKQGHSHRRRSTASNRCCVPNHPVMSTLELIKLSIGYRFTAARYAGSMSVVDRFAQSCLSTATRKRNALLITETELKLIASAAIVGDKSQPVSE